MTTDKKTVSLVLGSGGARGLAHIGVIRWLEEHGYKICSISGCSIGALIGGIHACDNLSNFVDWVRPITKLDILKLLDITVGEAGLMRGDRIIGALTELVGDRLIEDLPIHYTAVATDIVKEKEVWMTSGLLFDAIRASISLPLFFTPVTRNGMKLLDGGILNPVPIAPTFQDRTDLTIAVNLGGELNKTSTKPEQPTDTPKPDQRLHEKIMYFIEDLKHRNPITSGGNWEMLDIVNQTFDAMQSTIARQKLAAYPPDRVITIARNVCGTLEFDRADEMMALGYSATESQMNNPSGSSESP